MLKNRRRLIAWGIVFSFFGLLLLGLYRLPKVPAVKRWVKIRILDIAERQHVNLQFADIELSLLPPSLILKDCTIKKEETVVQAEHIGVRINPWPDSKGRLVISHLSLQGLNIEDDLEKIQQLSFESSKSADKPPTPIFIRSLSLEKSDIKLRLNQRQRLRIRDLQIEQSTGFYGGQSLSIASPHIHFENNGRAGPEHYHGSISTELSAQSSDWTDGFRIERLAIALDEENKLSLKASIGHWDPAIASPKDIHRLALSGLQLEAHFEIERIFHLLRKKPPLKGAAQIALRTENRSTCKHPIVPFGCLAGDFAVQNFQWQNRRIGSISSAWSAGKEITFKDLAIEDSDLGLIKADLTLPIRAPETLHFESTLQKVAFARLLERFDIQGSWLQARVDGHVSGDIQIRPLAIDLDTDLQSPELKIYSAPYYESTKDTILNTAPLSTRASLRITDDEVVLKRISMADDTQSIEASGRIEISEQTALDITIQTPEIVLQKLGPIASARYAGHGPLSLKVLGPADAIRIEGKADLYGFAIENNQLGRLQSDIEFTDSTLSFFNATLRQREQPGRGSGRVDIDLGAGSIEGAIRVEALDVHRTARDFQVPLDVLSDMETLLAGTIEIAGPLDRMQIRGKRLQGPVAIKNSDYGSTIADIAINLGDPAFLASVGWKWNTPAAGDMQGSFRVTPAHSDDDDEAQAPTQAYQYFCGLAFNAFPLDGIDAILFAQPTLDGIANGTLTLTGLPHALMGEISGELRDIKYYDLRLGTVALNGQAEKSKFQIFATLPNLRAKAEAEMALSFPYAYAIKTQSPTLPLEVLYPLPESIEGAADVQASISGDLSEQADPTMLLNISGGEVRASNLVTTLQDPITITYKKDTFTIPQAILKNPQTTVTFGGNIGLSQAQSRFNIDIQTPLAYWTPAVDALEISDGRINANVLMKGTMTSPRLSGDVQIRRANATSSYLNYPVNAININARLKPNRIEIQEGTAKSGLGNIRLSGEIENYLSANPKLSLRTSFEDVSFRPTLESEFIGQGSMEATGRFKNLKVEGDIGISAFEYARESTIDWLAMLPQTATPLQVPVATLDQTIDIDIGLQTLNTGRIKAGDLEGSFDANLRMIGTQHKIGLVGQVLPRDALIRYRDIDFNLEPGGVIQFREPYNIVSEFNITVFAEACETDIWVHLLGDNRSPNLQFRGQDASGPVDAEDVFICISTGRRLAAFNEEDAGSNRNEAVETGVDLLWQLSGLGDRVREVVPYFDDVRLTAGLSEVNNRNSWRIVLSKNIGSNLKLRYNGALDATNDHELVLEYGLSQRMRLEGNWNSRSEIGNNVPNVGLDLRLQWDFD